LVFPSDNFATGDIHGTRHQGKKKCIRLAAEKKKPSHSIRNTIPNLISPSYAQAMQRAFDCFLAGLGVALLFCDSAPAQTAPADPEVRTLLERAVAVRPSDRQVAWQQREFIAFTHFGPNTFTDREWGTGQEKEAVFNPTALDCRQWVRVLKDGGMTQVILTAKHHDGFCLWPSRFTEHSVKNSPWRDGHGDVVRELAEACHEAGLKLGLYLSPADLNAIERGVYGKTEAKARVIPSPVAEWTPKSRYHREGSWDEYNTYFLNQLFELLTEYGEISEVWFDGANPKPGTGQQYAYSDWYALIRALQPGAVIFGKGPDVRWCGNEAGHGRTSEWSVIPLPVAPEKFDWPDMMGDDLGSLAKLKGAPYLHWYPSEVDVSIRPGWFWHAKEDNEVKSLEKLIQIYFASAGNNAVLLLNVPPDRRGLIHESDAARLHEFGEWLRSTFKTDLARGAKASAAQVRSRSPAFSAEKTVDGAPETFWMTDDWQNTAEITYQLPARQRFNIACLQEDIQQGQRICAVALDAWQESEWREISRATTVGYKRLLRFAPVETDRVRVRILDSRVCPTLASFGLYLEEKANPKSEFRNPK
jgi:alpha-L-fucosidase